MTKAGPKSFFSQCRWRSAPSSAQTQIGMVTKSAGRMKNGGTERPATRPETKTSAKRRQPWLSMAVSASQVTGRIIGWGRANHGSCRQGRPRAGGRQGGGLKPKAAIGEAMSSLPVTLAIDTAAPRLQLALLRADGGVDLSLDDIATGHAEILFSRLEVLLKRNDLGHADLQRIAVTTGPGSFTGLRIGLSAARGLGLARQLPVVGIPSLLALSLGVAQSPVAVLLDARRGEAYFQSFASPGVALTPPLLLPMDEARGLVPADATLIESPFVAMA